MKKASLYITIFLLLGYADLFSQESPQNRNLINACISGNLNSVKMAINDGADINYLSSKGMPLYVAIQNGKTEVAKFLLSNEYISIHPTGVTQFPIHLAVKKRNLPITKILIEKGANINCKTADGFFTVDFAVRNNDYAMTRLLLDNGFDNKHCGAGIVTSVEKGNEKIFNLLVDHSGYFPSSFRDAAFYYAVKRNNYRIAKRLTDSGDLGYCFDSIEIICNKKMHNFMELLLNNKKKHVIHAESTSEYFGQLLYFAKDPKMLTLVIDAGAPVNFITYYSRFGEKNATIFSEKEIDRTRSSLAPQSPLFMAIYKNQIWKAELLLKKGAAIRWNSSSGMLDAMEYARFLNRNTMILVLRKYDK